MQLLNTSARLAALSFALAGAFLVAGCGGGGSTDASPAPEGGAVLTWDAADPAMVAGYRVYFGTASRAYDQALGYGVAVGGTTTYTVTGLTRAQTYYFSVTSVDARGTESAYSNEASKVIP
jgi:Fibronectin type III domain